MSALQVRKPTTELEERLITDDIVVLGEVTELSKDVKAVLGYSGIVAFDSYKKRYLQIQKILCFYAKDI